MSARRVSAAAGVVRAAIGRGQQAPGIATALESAGLLQSPETAAEQLALLAEVNKLRARVAELEAAPLAWAEDLDAKSLDNFLIALGSATEYEPMNGAIDQIHELVRSYQAASVQPVRKDKPALSPEEAMIFAALKAAGMDNWEGYSDAVEVGLSAAPSLGELAEQRHLIDPLDHVLEHLAAEGAEAALLAKIMAPDKDTREPGSCDACGDAPSAWCPDCGACRKGCHGGHDGSCTHPNAPWAVAS
ncbi:hypothetical protein [Streptomyces sp. NPDC058092]|uniref:hypothetical protein n=1 Tax=Streptomyces sp. NPDC058092 TaxID=3346336 RepID=UPI0036E880C7